MGEERFWHWRGNALMLHCQVQPGASREGIIGEHGGRLRIRISAPPAEGAANARLCRVLGEAFGVPASRVSLERGGASRYKTVVVYAPERFPEQLGIRPDE